MGSFSVSCGISGLPITAGKRVGFVMITLQRFLTAQYVQDKEVNRFRKSQYVYPTDNYAPIFPALYGTYDDYGKLENIEHGPATKLIEEHYGVPIDDVLKALGDDWQAKEIKEKHPDNEALKTLEYVHSFFYLPEIFTQMSDFIRKDDPWSYASEYWDVSKHWDEFLTCYREEEDGRPKYWFAHDQPVMDFLRKGTSFPLGLDKLAVFAVDEMKEPVADLQNLTSVLTAINRVYQPSFCGEQYGYWDASRLLNELSAQEIKKAQEESEDDWDEDDDEDDLPDYNVNF
jgi:hypothetical protein